MKLKANPVAGVGQLIAVTRGFALILLVCINTVIDHGHTVDNTGAFLAEVHVGVLEKASKYGAEAGHAIRCPMGYVACVIGSGPANMNKKDQTSK